MIRGGAEYSLGIYITGVDKGSEAESTGLKVRATPEQAGGGRRASHGQGCRHGALAHSCLCSCSAGLSVER